MKTRNLACALGVIALLALLLPWHEAILRSALVPGLGAGLVAYLLRRRIGDAALVAAAVLAADLVEAHVAAFAFAAVLLPLLALTRRPRFSVAVAGALMGLLLAAVQLKMQFAGSVLTWQDVQFFFLQFEDNVGVMASQPTLLLYAGGLVACCAVAAWLAWRWDGAVPAAGWPPSRIMLALGALSLAVWSGSVVRDEALRISRAGAWHMGEIFHAQAVSRFFATAALRPVWTPAPRDTTSFRRMAQQRVSAAGASAHDPADIVVALQESQFNPATIAGCPASLCKLPVFRAPGDAVAHGPLQVHVFGGGTWLTEFTLEAGVPHDVFGPAGDFAPFNVAPGTQRSFVRSLKAAGYRTVVVYPTGGGMMNARSAYAAYGFDRFYDSRDLGMKGRFDTSDEEMHAAARRVLAEERGHGQPVFLMLLTIFNHAEHGIRLDRVPRPLLERAAAAFPDRKEAESVADYIWRTGEFQRALAATRAAVLDAGRPAVFAWFGDHQPPFGRATSLRDRIRAVPTESGEAAARYQTWYQVSSNRNHPGTPPPRALDIVFLPGVLAEAAGVPLDDWLAANVTAREECGGLLQSCRKPDVPDAYLSYLWNDLQAVQLP